MASTSVSIQEPAAHADRGPKQVGHQPAHVTNELRVVLVGARGCGRTSSANTILGKPAFDTKTLVKESLLQKGDVFGQKVSVVDTVGLYWTHDQATQRLKDEICQGLDLCPPGPHAFLLVIPLDGFTLCDKADVEDILSIFGERAWDQTIVLFTFGDWLKDRSIGQYLEEVGPDLQEVLEKCGNRFHVFNNVTSSDSSQVTELLDKIKELVMENGGHYISDEQGYQEMRERLQWLERKLRKKYEEEWQKRVEELRQKSENMTEEGKLPCIRRNSKSIIDVPNLSELRIVMLGRTGAGKSAAGNTILGKDEFRSEPSSCSVTQHSQKAGGCVLGRRVRVVDTPDWLLRGLSLDSMRQDMGLCLALSSPGPHAFLLVVPVGRSSGEEIRLVEMLQDVFGTEAVEHAMVLFTHADRLKHQKIEDFVQQGSDSLRELVKRCGNRYHGYSSDISGDDTQVMALLEKVEALVLEHGGHFYSSEAYERTELHIKRRQEEIERDREEAIQAEEDQLRERHQEEVQMSLWRTEADIQEQEDRVQELIIQMRELRERLQDDQTDVQMKAKLEGDLRRVQEQKEDLEQKKERMRAEQKGKLRGEIEELRRCAEVASRQEAERCEEVLRCISDMAIKSTMAARALSHSEEMEELKELCEEKAQEAERYKELLQKISIMAAQGVTATHMEEKHHEP